MHERSMKRRFPSLRLLVKERQGTGKVLKNVLEAQNYTEVTTSARNPVSPSVLCRMVGLMGRTATEDREFGFNFTADGRMTDVVEGVKTGCRLPTGMEEEFHYQFHTHPVVFDQDGNIECPTPSFSALDFDAMYQDRTCAGTYVMYCTLDGVRLDYFARKSIAGNAKELDRLLAIMGGIQETQDERLLAKAASIKYDGIADTLLGRTTVALSIK